MPKEALKGDIVFPLSILVQTIMVNSLIVMSPMSFELYSRLFLRFT